jgi:hypothetical protein
MAACALPLRLATNLLTAFIIQLYQHHLMDLTVDLTQWSHSPFMYVVSLVYCYNSETESQCFCLFSLLFVWPQWVWER